MTPIRAPIKYLNQFCGSKGIRYCPYFGKEKCEGTCDATEESQEQFKRDLEQLSQNLD